MKRTITCILVCISLIGVLSACGKKQDDSIAYWNADSPAMASVISFVASVTDEKSKDFVPEDKRIVVLDMDGTLYGELFPTYFDESLLLHRLLHDESYQASEEDLSWAKEAEKQMQLAGTTPGGSFSLDGKSFNYGVMIPVSEIKICLDEWDNQAEKPTRI